MTKKQKERIVRLAPNGIPRWVRCYDNGGESADRYTVLFTGRYTHKTGGQYLVLGMSNSPFSPQGVGLSNSYSEIIDCPGRGYTKKWPPKIGRKNHLGIRINFEDLPTDCKIAVSQDYAYLWDISLEALKYGKRQPSVSVKAD